jgi:hypothetical protein
VRSLQPPSRLAQRREQGSDSTGAVAVLALPAVAELGDRARLADGNEHRVVAEATRPPSLAGDPAVEDSPAAELHPFRREEDELADVARGAVGALGSGQLREELADVVLVGCARPGEACRADPGGASEALGLEPGVLAQDPVTVVREVSFRPGVLVEAGAGLLGQGGT